MRQLRENFAGTDGYDIGLRSTMMPFIARENAVHRQQCLEQAARCRRLAYAISDRQAADALLSLAEDYERNAWNGGARAATI